MLSSNNNRIMLSSDSNSVLRAGFVLGKGNKLLQDAEREILRLVFWGDDVTQSRIVDVTGIPQQTVSRSVKSLIERGVLEQSEKSAATARGKPGFELKPNPSFAYTLGVSILFDSVALVLMDFKGQIISSCLHPMSDMKITHVLDKLESLITELIAGHNISEDKILGMGIGISGFFSSLDGKMNTHHMIEEWAEIDIAQIFSTRFSLPIWVVNDATAAAAGEGIAGVGRKFKNFVYVFISTGFGGGLISNNEMLVGTFGNAGELGDMLPPKHYVHPNLELLKRILINNGVDIESIYQLRTNFDMNWPRD
ncbi:ROK family transcriptional regulator [Paraglaciecola aquimarina]|uniref:ROK family transcriptional regulator n=1 Tax=Paraglaciecola aquimarina TaxID=1235557 RepID=A0ABU3SWE2_9ALTE|nr:ROK family transcriptional regulator [Paraglaciecola aquimarina]MDU0354324.1 ROK family transcriptional regulator [Paraglaciecola aquimarina]